MFLAAYGVRVKPRAAIVTVCQTSLSSSVLLCMIMFVSVLLY
jgi:hypothetical protein